MGWNINIKTNSDECPSAGARNAVQTFCTETGKDCTFENCPYKVPELGQRQRGVPVGGHLYDMDGDRRCINGCGCWMGVSTAN